MMQGLLATVIGSGASLSGGVSGTVAETVDDTPCLSILKHPLKIEWGAAE